MANQFKNSQATTKQKQKEQKQQVRASAPTWPGTARLVFQIRRQARQTNNERKTYYFHYQSKIYSFTEYISKLQQKQHLTHQKKMGKRQQQSQNGITLSAMVDSVGGGENHSACTVEVATRTRPHPCRPICFRPRMTRRTIRPLVADRSVCMFMSAFHLFFFLLDRYTGR